MQHRTILIAMPELSTDRVRVVDGVFEYARTCRDWHVEVVMGDWSRIKEVAKSALTAGLVLVRQTLPLSSVNRAWVVKQTLPIVFVQDLCDGFASVTMDPTAVLSLARSQWEQAVVNELCLATRCSHDPLWKHVQQAAAEMKATSAKWVIPPPAEEANAKAKLQKTYEKFVQATDRTAVLTSDSRLAIELRAAAKRCEVAIPEQMSIISCWDSDECSLPLHSITAIEEPIREIGFQAARMLGRMIQDKAATGQRVLIAPTQLHIRESCCSDFNHPSIALATNFIQQNATLGITVEDVLKTQDSSRVTFERRFRQITGQSPAEMIRKCRVSKAKDLLLETDRSIAEIAKECGFSTSSKFSAFFSKLEGISPLKYRRRFAKT